MLTDFSERAFRAASMAMVLAANNKKKVLLYHSIVLPETGLQFGDIVLNKDDIDIRDNEAQLKLVTIANQLKQLNKDKSHQKINIELKVGMGAVHGSIISLLKEYEVWMIVMGNRVAGDWKNISFGSNITPVTNSATCPVLLVP